MGGIGSGTWRRPSRKKRVEESLTIGMNSFLHHFHPVLNDSLFFEPVPNCEAPVDYHFYSGVGDDEPAITLRYRCLGQVRETLPIRLQTTKTNFGGRRWWFCCAMQSRVAYLYLPIGAHNFACRVCHDLKYRSTQEAHGRERCLRNPVIRRALYEFSESFSNCLRELRDING